MAKLAVILFLFALCAVAMSARIAREEPTNKPLDQFQDQIKNLAEQFQAFVQNPEFKKTLENFANNIQESAKQVSDKIKAQVSEAPKALI